MRRAADDLAHALRTLAGRALCGEAIGHGQTQGRLQKQKGRPTWGHAQCLVDGNCRGGGGRRGGRGEEEALEWTKQDDEGSTKKRRV